MAEQGRYAKGVIKREKILEAALSEYEKNGYDRTSFREIARQSGLTQAGLLHYFPTKESIFIELLRRRDERWEDVSAKGRHGHSVGQLIEAVRQNESEAVLVRLIVNMSAESTSVHSGSRSFFEKRYAWLRSEIADDVRTMQSQGAFRTDCEAEDVATVLIAVADGLQVQWLLDEDRVKMSSQLSRLWDMLRQAPLVDASRNVSPEATMHLE